MFLDAMGTGTIPAHYERQFVTKQGAVRRTAWYNAILRDRHGAVIGAASIGEDITEREPTEGARAQLVAAIEQAGDMVLITDAEGVVRYVNAAYERIAGYTAADVQGRRLRDLIYHIDDGELHAELWRTVTGGEVWRGRIVAVRKRGDKYLEDATVSPVRDQSGRTIGFVKVARDVTRQTALQEQLRQSQKMEAIGRFAGGMAHDFNNLLTVILGYTEVVQLSLGHESPLSRPVDEIHKAASRASELTNRVLAFTRKAVAKLRIVNLNAVLADVERMLRRIIGEDVQLVVEPAPDLWNVTADPNLVEQILLNLASNARDAMPRGGKLLVETANALVDQEQAARFGGIEPGEYVLLSVADTGTGMDEHTKGMVFEPFFSTKGEKGTGLGLSIVYGIVKQHNGHVFCESEPGKGSVFKLFLPATHDAAETEPVPERPSAGRPLAGTILVVEDEPTVMRIAARVLEQHGYSVLQAPTGAAAIEIARTHGGPIDLVLCDVVLPDMRGSEVAKEVLRLQPRSRVVYASGYADDVIVDDGVLRPGTAFLKQPYGMSELVRAVEENLSGPKA